MPRLTTELDGFFCRSESENILFVHTGWGNRSFRYIHTPHLYLSMASKTAKGNQGAISRTVYHD